MKKKGFTLVELLVVMAMTAIMIAVTLTSLSGAKDRKAVEGEARKLAATIRELQNYALTGKKFDKDPQPTCWIGVPLIRQGNSSYSAYYRHRHDLGMSCTDAIHPPEDVAISHAYDMQNGVIMGIDVEAFGFVVPRGTLVSADGDALANVHFQVLKILDPDDRRKDIIYSVCVYSSGTVEEKVGDSC